MDIPGILQRRRRGRFFYCVVLPAAPDPRRAN
jgi:hypothetical protein